MFSFLSNSSYFSPEVSLSPPREGVFLLLISLLVGLAIADWAPVRAPFQTSRLSIRTRAALLLSYSGRKNSPRSTFFSLLGHLSVLRVVH